MGKWANLLMGKFEASYCARLPLITNQLITSNYLRLQQKKLTNASEACTSGRLHTGALAKVGLQIY